MLSSAYNQFLSITEPTTNEEKFIDDFLNTALPKDRSTNVLNTYKTEGNYSHPQLKKYKVPATGIPNDEYFSTNDGLWETVYMCIPHQATHL